MERIRIDDGSKTYEIVNQDDKILGTFTFNPADVGLVEKYNAVIKELESVFSSLDGDGESEGRLVKASDELKAKMDTLFGYDTSPFWAICSPLSPLASGELYVENVLSGVAAVIEKETSVRLKKTKRKIDEYTKSYEAKAEKAKS